MAFTIGGERVPEPEQKVSTGRPVKVRTERRGNTVVTIVLNLTLGDEALKDLASFLKKRLGGGGTAKDGVIEIQGDKQDQVQRLLREKGIKSQ